ncbi:MAG: hypothetical protein K1X72_23295 [Pyrinomonadaceae bacterium]|nr:hypothetical protein [Pyrinomonadaceae bacterium]
MNNQSPITEKEREMKELAQKIYNNCLSLNELDRKSEGIEDRIDSLRHGLQQEIVLEKCPETGKPKHTNDLARKAELTKREQEHEPLKMLKADRLDHIESVKNLQALIEFQRKQFLIGEKMLLFLANQG